MSFFDRFNKKYTVHVFCYNCSTSSEVSVPKGTTVDGFLSQESGVCPACGCSTLRRVMKIQPTPGTEKPVKQYPSQGQQWQQQSQPIKQYISQPSQQQPPQRQQSPQRPPKPQSQSQPQYWPNRPVRQKERARKMDVNYPAQPMPVQNQEEQKPFFDMSPPKKINIWTGNEEG
jgi:hypothetical protein